MDTNIMQIGLNIINRMRNEKTVWKPGKDKEHLIRRKELNHIAEDATMDDYNNLIKSIVNTMENELYLYYKEYFNQKYFAIGDIEKNWEVIVGENGVMETAYEITDAPYKQHFEKKGYSFLGTLKEVEDYVDEQKN